MCVKKLIEKYPNVDATIFIGGKKIGINPKINNMFPGYQAAKYDYVLISDSGIRSKHIFRRFHPIRFDSYSCFFFRFAIWPQWKRTRYSTWCCRWRKTLVSFIKCRSLVIEKDFRLPWKRYVFWTWFDRYCSLLVLNLFFSLLWPNHRSTLARPMLAYTCRPIWSVWIVRPACRLWCANNHWTRSVDLKRLPITWPKIFFLPKLWPTGNYLRLRLFLCFIIYLFLLYDHVGQRLEATHFFTARLAEHWHHRHRHLSKPRIKVSHVDHLCKTRQSLLFFLSNYTAFIRLNDSFSFFFFVQVGQIAICYATAHDRIGATFWVFHARVFRCLVSQLPLSTRSVCRLFVPHSSLVFARLRATLHYSGRIRIISLCKHLDF